MKTIKNLLPILLICISISACKENANVSDIFEEEKPKNDLAGTKLFLEEDGVQILLPEDFKRYSNAEYNSLLDSLSKKKEFEIHRQKFDYVRGLNGNNYIYFQPDKNVTYMINSIPFAPIEKKDAQKLLSIIRQNHKKAQEKIKVDFTKITAKHTEITNAQIFKAIFKADLKKEKRSFYEHTYYISSNDKSVLINIMSMEELNFDPYVEKMFFKF